MSLDLYSEELEARLTSSAGTEDVGSEVPSWWIEVQGQRVAVELAKMRVASNGQVDQVVLCVDFNTVQQLIPAFKLTAVGCTRDSKETLLHTLSSEQKQYRCDIEVRTPMTVVTVYLNGR